MSQLALSCLEFFFLFASTHTLLPCAHGLPQGGMLLPTRRRAWSDDSGDMGSVLVCWGGGEVGETRGFDPESSKGGERLSGRKSSQTGMISLRRVFDRVDRTLYLPS